jgi:biopolymer transport protein ExbB
MKQRPSCRTFVLLAFLGSAFAHSPAFADAAAAQASNPYGIGALWTQSDAIAKTVLAIMVLMSLLSWYVIADRLWEQWQMKRQGRQIHDAFWRAPCVAQAAQGLDPASPYRYIAEAGIEGTQVHATLRSQVDFNEWVSQTVEKAVVRVQRRLHKGLSVLATVGSTAPFVGLFGTVWGIYHALTAIGVAGQASIDKVAGPVGESLIMTAIGLAVAVPAVLGYNWLVRRNAVVIDDLDDFGSQLHTALLSDKAPAA